MTTALSRELERLTSSGIALADPAMDLRDREVRDRHGEAVGTVSDLLLDQDERRVRLVEITTGGGLLGIGKKHHLIPVEALAGGDPRTVYVDRSREEIEQTPEYTVAEGDEEEAQYAAAYDAYGVTPYWTQPVSPAPSEAPPAY
jgi:sporulation protein YlmC with PRC-barrel domain